MANGIDWFRWHHGSVNDPKFGLVAKKANARLGDVIAVWALILEQASANTDRGVFGEIDHEATDYLLGAEDGTTGRILAAMEARSLTTNGRITRWEDRQPKRERVDTTAADRKRAQRERERDSCNDGDMADVAPSHATSHQVTPREEKRREELKTFVASATEGCPDGNEGENNSQLKPQPTTEDQDAARWLLKAQQKVTPKMKPPNLGKWADHIRLMREVDGRTHREICELFQWAKADVFWSPNCQCPAKLREKWDQLAEKRLRSVPAAPARQDFAEVL